MLHTIVHLFKMVIPLTFVLSIVAFLILGVFSMSQGQAGYGILIVIIGLVSTIFALGISAVVLLAYEKIQTSTNYLRNIEDRLSNAITNQNLKLITDSDETTLGKTINKTMSNSQISTSRPSSIQTASEAKAVLGKYGWNILEVDGKFTISKNNKTVYAYGESDLIAKATEEYSKSS
jgi:hypothetical protein